MFEKGFTVALALKYLNALSINNFADRLLIQKKIYLTQRLGVNFGYDFGWYIKGPYSSSLTSIAYEVVPKAQNMVKGYEFDDDIERVLNRVNDLDNHRNRVRANLSSSSWYELLASIDFLCNNATWIKNNEKDSIRRQLKIEKPKYTTLQFNFAWEVLAQLGLVEE